MDNSSGIEDKLHGLRAQIPTLRELPALSPEFVVWLGKLSEVVEAAFGLQSDEMSQLRDISTELPPEFYDDVAARLDALGLADHLKAQLLTKLDKDGPEAVFRKRLYDYDDLIAALIHAL